MQKYLQKRIEEVTEQIKLATDPDWIAWGLITRTVIQKERGNTEAALEDLGAAKLQRTEIYRVADLADVDLDFGTVQ